MNETEYKKLTSTLSFLRTAQPKSLRKKKNKKSYDLPDFEYLPSPKKQIVKGKEKSFTEKIVYVESPAPVGPPGKDGRDGIDGKDAIFDMEMVLQKVREIIPPQITVEDVIKAIKSLKGNDRIDISNIRNGEQLASLAHKASGGFNMNDQRWHGGGSSEGDTVKNIDITDQIDGVTLVYTIPANTRVTGINYSSAPFSAWRVGVDYTLSGVDNVTLTFDNAIPPFSIGQTLTVTYVEA